MSLHTPNPFRSSGFLVACVALVLVPSGCDVFESDGPRPAEVVVLSDHEQGLTRIVLDPSPGVRVLDGRGEPIAGVQVRFQLQGGGGDLVGAQPRTDEEGEARVVSWRMGAQPGANVMTATVDGLEPVEFRVEARDPCQVVTPIELGESVASTLTPYHCRDNGARPMEMYELIVDEPSRFLLDMSSEAFVPFSGVLDESGFHVASNFLGYEGFARVAVAPGTYQVEARALSPGTRGGSYTLALSMPTQFSDGCGPQYYWWVSHGVEMEGEISGVECVDDIEMAREGERRDGYLVPYDYTVSVRFSVSADGPFLAAIWSHGRFRQAWRSEDGEELFVDYTPPTEVATSARVYVSALPGTTYRVRF